MLFVDRVLLTRREMVCDRVLDDLEQLHRGLGSSDAVLVQQLHHQSYKSKKKHYKICRYQLYDENKYRIHLPFITYESLLVEFKI